MSEEISAAQIIDATLTMSPQARAEYLAALQRQAQAGPAMYAAALSLTDCLDALRTAGGIDAHAALPSLDTARLEPGGMRNYQLGELLGTGGFAEVYAAQQLHPMKREVAIKILRPGPGEDMSVTRFLAEQQALAQLDHPGIAAVFDAGETDTGRPYFVMERVHGTTITAYCKTNQSSLQERLRLFSDVCEAVEYAHTRGLIHRDLKPSNVMVTELAGVATIKVIDFGIAKTMEQNPEAAPLTLDGELLGTPASMSPEQLGIRNDPIDRRTDVYALGMLLYELLTDLPPFEGASTESILLSVWRYARQESDILNVSRKALASDSNPRGFARALREDVDWIVQRAIAQAPEARYQSVAALRDDLQRFAKHQPVSAGPPSLAYRGTKFVRRHWVLLVAIGVIIGSLLFALIQTTAQQRKTEQALQDLSTLAGFQGRMLTELDPYYLGLELQRGVQAQLQRAALADDEPPAQLDLNYTDLSRRFIDRSILSRAREALDTRMMARPGIASQLRQSLGQVYLSLGLRRTATAEFEAALALRERVEDDDPASMLAVLGDLAEAYDQDGQYTPALDTANRRLAYAADHFSADAAPYLDAVSDLASIKISTGDFVAAQTLQHEAYEGFRADLGSAHAKTLSEWHEYATILHHQGQLDASLKMREQILAGRERLLEPQDQAMIVSLIGLGSIHHHLGNLSEAERFMRDAFARRRAALGDGHPRTLSLYNRLAALAYDQGRLDEAEALARDGVRRFDAAPELDQPRRLLLMATLGRVLGARGQSDEAIAVLQETYETSARVQGAENPETLSAYFNLAQTNLAAGHIETATWQFEDMQDSFAHRYSETHPRYGMVLVGLASAAVANGEYQHAARQFERAAQIYSDKFDLTTAHPLWAALLAGRAHLYAATDQSALAQRDRRRSRDIYLQLGRTRKADALTALIGTAP